MSEDIYPQVICISAFFTASDLLFRRFELRDGFDLGSAEKLILRARGKANLMRRSYAISRRLAKRIDAEMIACISWNFDRFYYQIGIFSAGCVVMPDGFLLTKKNTCDGMVVCHYAMDRSFDLSGLRECVDSSLLCKYEAIYLMEGQLSAIGALFGVKCISLGDYYFELTPIVRTQADFYLEKHKLRLV